MHGQNRSEYKARFLDQKVSAALAQKAQQWNALSKELISRRRPQEPDSSTARDLEWKSTLALTEKLLSVNPDPSHLWNRRREILIALAKTEEDVSINVISVGNEQILTARCLERNPKAYSPWFHRKWCIRHFLLEELSDDNVKTEVIGKWKNLLEAELQLCVQFLKLDERNFHCWNYRRFVVSALATVLTIQNDIDSSLPLVRNLTGSWNGIVGNNKANDHNSMFKNFFNTVMGPQIIKMIDTNISLNECVTPTVDLSFHKELLQNEWDFTREKIEDNFSNSSAFHYRSKLLPLILEKHISEHQETDSVSDELKIDLVREELELVQNAIFTEPDDQTAWWYHRFIISWAYPKSSNDSSHVMSVDIYDEILKEECESLRELIETENGKCKWALVGLHLVLVTLQKLYSEDQLNSNNVQDEANECLGKLIQLDPNRKVRYQSLIV